MGNRSNIGYSKQTDLESASSGVQTPATQNNLSLFQRFKNRLKSTRTSFSSGWKTIRMIAPYFWPKNEPMLRLRVVVCILILLLGRVINLYIPMLYRNAIDSLPLEFPIKMLLLYGLLRLIGGSLKDIRDTIFIAVDNNAARAISVDVFKHLQYLSLGFHLNRNTGALLKTVDRGKNAISSMLSTLGFTIIPTLVEVLMTCGFMFGTFGGYYAVITFFTIFTYVAFTLAVTEWRSKFRRAYNDKDNEASNTAVDSLLNFETVKYFTAEDHEIGRYHKALTEFFEVTVKTQYSLTFLDMGQILIITLGLTRAMILAASQVKNGILTIGDLVAVNAYIIQLYTPLNWLGTSYRLIINSFTDMEKLFDLINEKPDVKDADPPRELVVAGGEIEFKNVSFTYQSRGDPKKNNGVPLEPILKNVSFKILAGKTLAVVGLSGSGKTTIARLLCRFYDPQSGFISVDGQDITTVTQKSLRRKIGVVPQDTVLFNDTIYYNIAYGSISKDKEEVSMSVEQAAKEANIEKFIMSTPDKYATKVGERGLRLSGGEKQRVAIARTILKDPQILILDEATSALDSQTEKEIQTSLMQVSKGRTTLIIAHRLSTVIDADEIIVLKRGQILERGNHRELLNSHGEYYNLWEMQSKENSNSKEPVM